MFLDIIHRPVFIQKHCPVLFFKTQSFGDWILSPSSGKTFLLQKQNTRALSLSRMSVTCMVCRGMEEVIHFVPYLHMA
jgi:hypothetical protein